MLACRLVALASVLLLLASNGVRASAPADTLTIAVMATADLHGHVLPWDYYADRPDPRFGLSRIATLVDSVRAVHPHTLLLDSGDWLQGNPMAEYFARVDTLARYPLLAAADAMDYTAIVLGNHEFNFGIGLLERRIAQTATPVIGANIFFHGTDSPAYAPYVLRNVGGVNVGILGLTTPGSAVWDRPRVAGRLDFGEGLDAALRFIPEMRERGAEIVIVLAHSGLEGADSYDDPQVGTENFGRLVAEGVPDVDLLVLGHSHRVVIDEVPGYGGVAVPVIQAGRWGSHLGIAELSLVRDAETGRVHVAQRSLRAIDASHAASHPVVEELAREGHEAVRAYMSLPLATTTSPWPSADARREPSAVVDLVHHVQLEATGAQLSAAAAFSSSVTLGPDAITLGQLTQLYPYENALFVVEISGADLRRYLEHSASYYLPPDAPGEAPRVNPSWPGYNFDMIAGAEYALDLSRPLGSRVVELMVDGEPVRDEQAFTMAVNSYRALGGGGFPGMRDENVVLRIDASMRDIIADYLRERGSLEPEDVLMSRWELTPAPYRP